MTDSPSAFAGDRLAKIIARAGLCSRRDAELWIKDGRVSVNGKVIRTPAFNVTEKDQVKVDGQPLIAREGTRVWLYHKPAGLVVTEKDPEGRPTIFADLERRGLPRVVSVGRLDINTEGLLLLTNDGGLKRVLELPVTGWLRRYRVRAFGSITQQQLDALKDGLEVDGLTYGPIEATLEREQGSNVWLVLALREGKNREVKNVLAALGLKVNRLIRTSFGPFQLGDLAEGGVEVVKARVLREQLGRKLADEAGVDFDSELPEPAAIRLARGAANPALRASKPGAEPARQRKAMADRTERFRFTDNSDRGPRDHRPEDAPLRRDRPGSRFPRKPAPAVRRDEAADDGPPRKVLHDDGSETTFEPKLYGKKPKPAAKPEGDRAPFKKDFGDRPPRDFGDRPKRDFGSRDSSSAQRGRGTGEAGGGGGRTRDFGDKPKRDFGSRDSSSAQRGRGTGEAGGGGGRTRDFGDKPKRDFGDRPKRPYAPRSAEGADRPKRDYGDKPKRSYAPRSGDAGDRPKRPYAPRSAEGADRPKRDFGDKPKRPYAPRSAEAGDRPKRPYAPRGADGAARPPRDFGDKPKRSLGDRPRSARPDGDKPKRSFGDKPRAPRPDGDKPFGKRPRGSGPGGDRPRRPRPPKA